MYSLFTQEKLAVVDKLGLLARVVEDKSSTPRPTPKWFYEGVRDIEEDVSRDLNTAERLWNSGRITEAWETLLVADTFAWGYFKAVQNAVGWGEKQDVH